MMENMDKERIKRIIARAKEIIKKQDGEKFSQATIDAAWTRSGGRCECIRISCGHNGRCNKQLVYENRKEGERGAWEAHHIISKALGGKDEASNCQILCLDCHKKTESYGKHD